MLLLLISQRIWLICIPFVGLSDLCYLIFAVSKGFSWFIFFWCMLINHVISFRLLWTSVCSFFWWNLNVFLRFSQIFPHWHLSHQASDYFGRLISILVNISTHSSGYVAKWQRTLLTGSISRELRRGTSPCLVHISVSPTEFPH